MTVNGQVTAEIPNEIVLKDHLSEITVKGRRVWHRGYDAWYRQCIKCELVLLESTNFTGRSGGRHRGTCRPCMAKWGREYREANKDRIAVQRKGYREANRGHISEANKRWRRDNPDKVRMIEQRKREKNALRRDEINARARQLYLGHKYGGEHEFHFMMEVAEFAQSVGCLVYHNSSSKNILDAGRPDLHIAKNGAHIAVETKTPGGTVKPNQLRWLYALNGNDRNWGPNGYLLRPDRLEEMKDILRNLGAS